MIKFRDGVGRVGMTPVTLVGSRGMWRTDLGWDEGREIRRMHVQGKPDETESFMQNRSLYLSLDIVRNMEEQRNDFWYKHRSTPNSTAAISAIVPALTPY